MKLKSFKLVPVLIAAITIGLAAFFNSPSFTKQFHFLQHLELDTYDMRVRVANRFPNDCATNLAFVQLDEVTVKILADQYQVNWPFPRQVHGRLVRELSAQGAKVVGFDVLFGELRSNDSPVLMPDSSMVESDDFFARLMRDAGNVIIAAEAEPLATDLSSEEREVRILQRVFPPPLFATNAMAIGDIAANSDSDGVLRRARAYIDDPEYGRRWHMGIILAAKELGVNLNHAVIQPGKITLNAANGLQRIIPIDPQGFFYINWSIPYGDARLATMSYALPVLLDDVRNTGSPEERQTNYLQTLEIFRAEFPETKLEGDNPMRGKLVVVGSQLVGNNVTDLGTTPLRNKDYLVSKHWNVANSIITGQFIRRSPYTLDLLIIVLMGILSAVLTLQLRALCASLSVIALIAVYIAAAFFLFVKFRYWIPVALPVIGAMLMTHICMVTYRVRVEQKERRRVKDVFTKIVSPDVVNELLNVEKLSLEGARRKITVFFADVRGFTEMTDQHQTRAEDYVRENNLTGDVAEVHYDEQAHETLTTVNLYLATIANKVKEHKGTLDKYIGDCVMAFWGAPIENKQHALSCVRAAIDSQRGMHVLNQERALENQRREQENLKRMVEGEPLLHLLPLLSLGTGINSGTAIVGLMGSAAHILNYTVFGRVVNLASRLESVSGRGRIIIGESTFFDLQRDDPQLAATCVELPAVTVKGIKNAVKIYEVPWKVDSEIAKTESTQTSASSETAKG